MSRFLGAKINILIGDSPVVVASVKAVIERPGGDDPVTINAKDNGAGE